MNNSKYLDWIKHHKVWSAVIAFFLLALIAGIANPPEEKKAEQQNSPAQNQTTQEQSHETQSAQSTIPKYEIVKEFGTNNSNKAVLISADNAMDEKLVLLGKELNNKYSDSDFIRIGIFTDRQHAETYADIDKVFSLEGDEATAYDNAYVAQFNINKSTGLKEYVLRPSRDAKEISL